MKPPARAARLRSPRPDQIPSPGSDPLVRLNRRAALIEPPQEIVELV